MLILLELLAVLRVPVQLHLEEDDLRCVILHKVLYIVEHLLEGDGLVVMRAPDCLILDTDPQV